VVKQNFPELGKSFSLTIFLQVIFLQVIFFPVIFFQVMSRRLRGKIHRSKFRFCPRHRNLATRASVSALAPQNFGRKKQFVKNWLISTLFLDYFS
jgi:hypothetical protein